MVQHEGTVVHPRDALANMGIQPSRIRCITHRRNTHWLVDTPERRLVLRRYASDRTPGDVAYEIQLLDYLQKRGWPIPTLVAPTIEVMNTSWCAFEYMPGRAPAPRSSNGVRAEQRRRGQLLALLPADMRDMASVGQRESWRRADEGLFDRTGRMPADDVLAQYERRSPEDGRILRMYDEQMQERLRELLPYAPVPVVVHGDFTPWNIRFIGGHLSAILDFDAAHLDLRVADFALTWRGQYHDVVYGYEDVSPLEDIEKALIVPIFWAWIIGSSIAGMETGEDRNDWAVKQLLRTEQARIERLTWIELASSMSATS